MSDKPTTAEEREKWGKNVPCLCVGASAFGKVTEIEVLSETQGWLLTTGYIPSEYAQAVFRRLTDVQDVLRAVPRLIADVGRLEKQVEAGRELAEACCFLDTTANVEYLLTKELARAREAGLLEGGK